MLSKVPLIFIGSIAAAIIITVLAVTVIAPQDTDDPDILGIAAATQGANGTFYRPSGIDFLNKASNEGILVADTFNHRIQILNPDFSFNNTFGIPGDGNGEFYRPYGVTTNDTHILVADTFNHRIQIFNTTGFFLQTFGTAGDGDGQFYRPYDVSTNASKIFVADSFNQRIQIFDLSGNFISKTP